VFIISRRAAEALAIARDRAFPAEACGVLLGARRGRRMFASEIVVSRTSTASRGEFEIPDFELRRIKAWGEDRHLQMLAIFHSHPSGDHRLSAADRAALRHSEWPWLIVTRSRARDAPVVLTGYRPGDARRTAVHVE
jgi:proteasome lid subunit RPN8/RPN11